MDEIQYATERDLPIRNVDRESSLLRDVRDALRRIHDGDFGNMHGMRIGDQPKTPRGGGMGTALDPVPGGCRSGPAGGNGICQRDFPPCGVIRGSVPSSSLKWKKVGAVMKAESSIRNVAFISNYLPRKCGIATFTSDLLQAVAARHTRSRCFAVPVNDIDGWYEYPDIVRFEIEEQDLESYRRAADFQNASNVDIVSVQHEFRNLRGASR